MKLSMLWIVCLLIFFPGCNFNSPGINEESTSLSLKTVSNLTDLSASTDIQQLLCQNWEHKEDAADAEATGGGGSIEIPYRGLSFFQDGRVTENPRDKIRFGTWHFNAEKKQISVEYDGGARSSLKIGAIGPRQMILLNMTDKNKTVYKADALAQKEPADDPFHPSNSDWRMKPSHSETDTAIKNRVRSAVLFYAKFLKDNGSREGNTISFVGLPTCFKWYKGGISITATEKLGEKWINCFFNREQAVKGQQMLDRIITKKYKWNKQESNWVKQSADVMKQIYDTLK